VSSRCDELDHGERIAYHQVLANLRNTALREVIIVSLLPIIKLQLKLLADTLPYHVAEGWDKCQRLAANSKGKWNDAFSGPSWIGGKFLGGVEQW